MISYVSTFYLTICLHITPMQLSGKILDIFMLLELELVDHILIGLLEAHRQKILEMDNASDIMDYFKNKMMSESLLNENIGFFINEESLKKLIRE